MADKFIHYTCDNIDILDETLDGKNTSHATQMAAWQRGQPIDDSVKDMRCPLDIGPTLNVPNALMELHPLRITPRTFKPTFSAPIAESCFGKSGEEHKYAKQAKATDLAFFLHCQNLDMKTSWSVFNQSLSSKEQQTAAGYLPIVLATAHVLIL